ncbi:MAG TPA: PhnD/SsuA/transferrin family substrate-binding protein [Kofleriaceae bacterium]|nr:PhnD/SsuA/transferrin family substrate-binding protein [Kofleriaceae bacterium]
MRALLTCALLLAWSAPALGGGRITVGLYAPSAPFDSPSDRLQYVTRLADHLEPAAGGAEVVGRVFARASDFVAALRRGELQFAVIDAPYAAARGLPYRALAAATRGGAAEAAWLLVTGAGMSGLSDLRGRTLAVARTGAREAAFVSNVLLEGEVDAASYFGGITLTPDSLSAATLVKLGRADAALVPAGVAIPDGLRVVGRTRPVGWPMFVALPGAAEGTVAAFANRVASFGDGALPGMAAVTRTDYAALRAAFGRAPKRPVMPSPRPARLSARDLLPGRVFEIAPIDPLDLVSPASP